MPSEPEFLEFDLNFVFYPAPDLEGVTCAHCLELDVVGQGSDVDEARKALMEAVELYVECKASQGEVRSLFLPAAPEVWNLEAVERWRHRILVRLTPAKSKTGATKADVPYLAHVTFSAEATRLQAHARAS